MSTSPAPGGPGGTRTGTVARAVLLLALTGLIAVDIAFPHHAPVQLAGTAALCALWLVNAWGLLRRLRGRR